MIKRIIYGAQKQANRANDAVVNFVERYLVDKGYMTGVLTEMDEYLGAIVSALQEAVDGVVSGNTLASDTKLFVSLLIDKGDRLRISEGCVVKYEAVSDTGKHVFYVASGNNIPNTTPLQSMPADVKERVEREVRTASKEDEAMALVQEILKDCPNRGDYPEDDVLAAILYGEIYWNK